MVNRLLKNGALQLLKGLKNAPPQLPPRDTEIDEFSETLYENSHGSEYEKNLVEKMYYNNLSQRRETESSLVTDQKSPNSQNSKNLGTGNFGKDLYENDGQKSSSNR